MKFKENWKRFWTLSRASEGFTLVELIVVIAILAILSGVAVPAYSGYIKKAEKASDLQLLGAVNSAFAAAVMDRDQKSATELANGSVSFDVASMKPSDYQDEFAIYFAGNEGKFKVITSLTLQNGVFSEVVLSDAFVSVLEKLTGSEDIPAVLASIFGDMGAGTLMDKVAGTSDLAAALLGTSDGKFSEMILNCGSAMAELMGLDPESAEFQAVAKDMMVEKMLQLKASDAKYADIDVDALYTKLTSSESESPSEIELELFNSANNSISANNAILAAAQKSEAASSKIFDTLKVTDTSNPKSNLIAAVNAGIAAEDTSESMAQVAMAYGLYTAYAQRNGLTVSDDPSVVLNALDDDGFQTYLTTKDAETDLAGYQASMNMVNSGVQGNTEAVSDVLVNGFDDPQIVAVLQQLFAQGSTK